MNALLNGVIGAVLVGVVIPASIPLRVAAAAVIGANHEDAGQLALRARRRLKRDGAHAPDLRQGPLQLFGLHGLAIGHGHADRLDAERLA